MNRRKLSVLLAAAALLVAGVAVILPAASPSDAATSGSAAREASGAPASLRPPALLTPPSAGLPGEAARTARAEVDPLQALRERYGARIAEPHIQMRVLEKLMRHFQQLNPSGWEADLLALVRQAFPERAEEMARLLRQRVEYGEWMDENEPRLRGKPDAERRAEIWDKRHQLFGKDVAEELWQGELRNTALTEALVNIDTQPAPGGVGERLERFQKSVTQTYGEEAPGFREAHQQELMNRFLDLGSVQKELAVMTAEQRAQSLREVRQGMGLDDAALERWKDLDARRDARWAMGEHYMAERATLAGQAAGPERDTRLAELRARYFPDEAQTIAEEEQSGFFRFSQPRLWGRN